MWDATENLWHTKCRIDFLTIKIMTPSTTEGVSTDFFFLYSELISCRAVNLFLEQKHRITPENGHNYFNGLLMCFPWKCVCVCVCMWKESNQISRIFIWLKEDEFECNNYDCQWYYNKVICQLVCFCMLYSDAVHLYFTEYKRWQNGCAFDVPLHQLTLFLLKITIMTMMIQ